MAADGDEGAARIYTPLKDIVECYTSTPVGPDPGVERPHVCLGDLDGKSLPQGWMKKLSEAFECPIATNAPFKGGCITQRHHREMPWIQLKLSRAPFMTNEEKSSRVIQALRLFCSRQFKIRPALADTNELRAI